MTHSFNNGGELRRLSDVAKSLPNRPSASTVWRWVTKGVRGIRLESTRLGGFNYVSDEALQTFLNAINEPSIQPPAKTAPRSARERNASKRRAAAILERAGI